MENDESTAQGAIRETREEAGASVSIEAPFALVSIPHINQVHLFYRGRLDSSKISAGDESLAVALLDPDNIPWDELAFRSVTLCLERYLDDLRRSNFGFHEAVLTL